MTDDRESDLVMLQELLDEEQITDREREAFRSMLDNLDKWHALTDAQRRWARMVHDRFRPAYQNLVSEGKVPRGREVPEPKALQHKPRKPPGRE